MTTRLSPSARRAVAGCGAIAMLSCIAPVGPATAADPVGPQPFMAETSSVGTRLTLTIPDAPVSNSIVDSGGPTAEASLSLGGYGKGYAAFPDPGPTLSSLPDLAGGVTGAPLPLPDYPAAVTANAGKPEASAGTGPYTLKAKVSDGQAAADALVGGNALVKTALVHSSSSVNVKDDGTVVATASSDVQGLTVGPLSLGHVTSTATRTLTPSGDITSSSHIAIDGVRVDNVAVSIDQDAVNVAGQKVPLGLGKLGPVLDRAGVKVTVEGTQEKDDVVVAPAVVIDAPVPSGRVGLEDGTFHLVLAGAQAKLVASKPPPVPDLQAVAPPAPPKTATAGPPPAATGAGEAPPIGSAKGIDAPVAAGPRSTAEAAPQAAPAFDKEAALRLKLASLNKPMDIVSVYLILAILAAAAFLTTTVIRLLGVRGPWTSTDG